MSEMADYEGHLENRSRDKTQPNGVSEGQNDWEHRSEMDKPNTVSWRERQSVSKRVNERRDGEEVRPKKDHGKEGDRASNENDDKLVDEGKTKAEKYADRYGSNDE